MFKLLVGSYRNYHQDFNYKSTIKKLSTRNLKREIRLKKIQKFEEAEKAMRFLMLTVTKAVN